MKSGLSYTQKIVLGFLAVILLGTGLLCLPAASRDGLATPFFDCLFTATSATCVTGLIVHDTATYWSLFGQIIIIVLIQIGGLGVMTVISMFWLFMKKKISLSERELLMQSAGNKSVGGVVKLIKWIIIGTFSAEGVGAVVLAFRFCPKMGFFRGVYNAVFHSVSAFCNAGFDLMGKYGRFSSLTTYADDAVVNITIMLLIVCGGLGFLVWGNIFRCRGRWKKLDLHSKLVISSTAFLLIGGAVLFFIFERDSSMASLSLKDRILASLFQSVTPRTAGFNTIDQYVLSPSGNLLTILLMFIGGSPGSTAGGIKTTTLAVLFLAAVASARKKNDIGAFKRRLEEKTVRQASAIAVIYLTVVIAAVMVIASLEPYSIDKIVYEVVSAIGTVGLTTGITTILSPVSQGILIFLMFAGRIGGLSLMLALAEKRVSVPLERPSEKILIG